MIPASETFTPEMMRLLELVEGNLFFIVKQIQTREGAVNIKERMSRPIGILNSKFHLRERQDLMPSQSLVLEHLQIAIDTNG